MSGTDLREVREELVTFARRAADRGLNVGTAGNFSLRIGRSMAITPSAVPYERMRPDEICLVRISDGELEPGLGRPSTEVPMHRAVYDAYDAGAVVHTHSPFVVAASCVLDSLPAVHYAMWRLGGPVRIVSYARFGTDQLAQEAVGGLQGRTAVILQNHGALTYGTSLAQAYERAVLLEWLAQVYWYAHALGEPRLLDERQLAEVRDANRGDLVGEGRVS